jgi:hypothetical protein
VDTNKLLRHAYATSEAELGRPSSDGEPASPVPAIYSRDL